MSKQPPEPRLISTLNERSRDIFRTVVEVFFDTGEPVGSRTLSRALGASLSPASIRNVMADLEEIGLLYSPHTSAGRLPTDLGLRLFVDGLLQIGDLTEDERASIEGQCAGGGRSLNEMLSEATDLLSGLTSAAGLVFAPKVNAPIKYAEFVPLSPGKALAILVTENGLVENRIVDAPPGLPAAALTEAANYLNNRLAGLTLGEARRVVARELKDRTAELDALSAKVVEAGIAIWSGDTDETKLILRGRANLFDDVQAIEDLDRIKGLFDSLERTQNLLSLIDLTEGADGVHVFIGSESRLFDLTGCSMIVAPLRPDTSVEDGLPTRCVGAIGVIGPTRLNYARIIPLVDFTARTINRLMS